MTYSWPHLIHELGRWRPCSDWPCLVHELGGVHVVISFAVKLYGFDGFVLVEQVLGVLGEQHVDLLQVVRLRQLDRLVPLVQLHARVHRFAHLVTLKQTSVRYQVSIATFKLDNCEAFIQLDGDDVTVAATVDHVTPEELGNVLLDRFQERFATGTSCDAGRARERAARSLPGALCHRYVT